MVGVNCYWCKNRDEIFAYHFLISIIFFCVTEPIKKIQSQNLVIYSNARKEILFLYAFHTKKLKFNEWNEFWKSVAMVTWLLVHVVHN